MTNTQSLLLACFTMVVLTFIVGGRMLYSRVNEMRTKKIHPQAIATSGQSANKLHDTQAADNFSNLFEVPVLFYALCAIAIASAHVPGWLINGAWLYVSLRIMHSVIHCTYNRVLHRLAAFATSYLVLIALWASFAFTYISLQ